MTELVTTKYFLDFSSKMAQLQRDDQFCDVAIHVDGTAFRCHRLVLSSASMYFDIMFKGNFQERSSTEITLKEIQASVFEEILQFIYTGKAVIHRSNLFEIIRAAEFYKIPFLLEFCLAFVKDNLNIFIDDIISIFVYSRRVGAKELIVPLGQHIYKNLHHLSKTAEFIELGFDELSQILDIMNEQECPLLLQDPIVEGIFTWVTHQANLTSEEKILYWDKAIEKIKFGKLSGPYRNFRWPKVEEEIRSPSTCGIQVSNQLPKLLRAYISRTSENGLNVGTSIYTGFSSSGNRWLYSGELDCSPEFMRNITVDGNLYSLRYFGKRADTNCPRQTFTSSSTISLIPSLALRPPPCIFNEFEMCSMANDIYIYNKCPLFPSYGATKDSFFFYYYKRDLGIWYPLPLPRPEFRYDYSGMTCEEGRVYLIGGVASNRCVQAYDPRMRGWSVLPPTQNKYSSASCCAFGKKICITATGQWGRLGRPYNGEIYDPSSGRSDEYDFGYRTDDNIYFTTHRSILGNICTTSLITYCNSQIGSSKIFKVDDKPHYKYTLLPSLCGDVEDSGFKFKKIQILDMFSF